MFPTREEFARKVQERRPLPWKMLNIFQIYRIDEAKEIKNGRFGDAVILKMAEHDNSKVYVWAPKLLINALKDETLPCFVKPMGIRNCKGDEKRTYETFELVSMEELSLAVEQKL